MIQKKEKSIICEEAGRVDKVLSAFIPRSVFSLEGTSITVNGKPVKKSFQVRPNDEVTVTYTQETFEGLEAEDIPLDVIYEDESILVIDKKAGMVVHPGAGNWSGTLVNALIHRYGQDFSTSQEEDDEDETSALRPGIVHRLDKDTSGVMIVAKTAQAHSSLVFQFQCHSNEKVYIAVVKRPFIKKRGTVDANIVRDAQDRKKFTVTSDPRKGKSAVTHYTVLRQNAEYAFIRVRIETGRTHQIRVHMKSIGHPVLGDPIYSRPEGRFETSGLCLHALKLSIDHPLTGERMTFYARMPERIRRVVKDLIRTS